MTKRIAFCIAEQHLIPHGGIGQFAKGFVELAQRKGWIVDILLDKYPSSKFRTFRDALRSNGANFEWPSAELSYSNHSSTFAFGEGPNFEKMANFRQVLMDAHEHVLYDLVICNTPEAMLAAYSLSLHEYTTVVFYTHNEQLLFEDSEFKGVFSDPYNHLLKTIMGLPGVIIGTQSRGNQEQLQAKYPISGVANLPMPMTERGLLEAYLGEQKGVLFIGRWEERKNPQAFVDLIRETGLPAKVLTNSSGAKKFQKAFSALGITDVEYGIGLQGQEKVDFIRKSKVHFNPAKLESFGFAFWECLGHMPCVTLAPATWVRNFKGIGVQTHAQNLGEAIRAVQEYHESTRVRWYSSGHLANVILMDKVAGNLWAEMVYRDFGKRSTTSAAKINQYDTTSIRQFILNLGRDPGIEDVQSLYANRHKYRIVQTATDTFLTKDESFTPPSAPDDSLESLFA